MIGWVQISHAVADRLARVLFFLLLLTGSVIFGGTACQGDVASSTTATPVNSGNDSQLAPSATDARKQASTSPLRFVPTATPDTNLDEVKAAVAAAGLEGLGGRAVDDSFYALIAECGGAITIKDSIIETMVPPDLLIDRGGWYVQSEDLLYPVKMQLIQGWEHTIEWSVNGQNRNEVFKVTASGYITNDCEVNTEVSKRPVP